MYYFASDTHLGAGSIEQQRVTERRFVAWLDHVVKDATAIFLCGDIFDFWFEYKYVIPKGSVRTLGKIAEITDKGVRMVFIAGNHDMWVRDYLSTECGMEIYTTPTTFNLGSKKVHIAHGDNLNVKKDCKLKIMNLFFRSKLARKVFSMLVHPNVAIKFGRWWSNSSRKKHTGESPEKITRSVGYLREYALKHYDEHKNDIYIFGHLHHAENLATEQPQIIFMNDWSSNPHYITINEEGEAKLHQVTIKQ